MGKILPTTVNKSCFDRTELRMLNMGQTVGRLHTEPCNTAIERKLVFFRKIKNRIVLIKRNFVLEFLRVIKQLLLTVGSKIITFYELQD